MRRLSLSLSTLPVELYPSGIQASALPTYLVTSHIRQVCPKMKSREAGRGDGDSRPP
jgi:hypothetical protein